MLSVVILIVIMSSVALSLCLNVTMHTVIIQSVVMHNVASEAGIVLKIKTEVFTQLISI